MPGISPASVLCKLLSLPLLFSLFIHSFSFCHANRYAYSQTTSPTGDTYVFFFNMLNGGLPGSVNDGSGHSCPNVPQGTVMIQYTSGGCYVLGTLKEVSVSMFPFFPPPGGGGGDE